MNIDQAVDTENTVEATSLGAHDDTSVQEGMKDKTQEDTVVVITHQLDIDEVENTGTLMACQYNTN